MRWAQKMLAGYIMSRVCLRWDYFFRLPFCIHRVACVELAHSSLGDWKYIFITHLIIIIKSEVSTFPIAVIFFRGCVSEMVVLSYSVIYYIYIPGKLGLCFHFWCSVYDFCKQADTLWPVGRVRLFADYTISFSYTLGREYREMRNRYSRLLFTSEDRLCANLHVQEQSTNMTSQC